MSGGTDDLAGVADPEPFEALLRSGLAHRAASATPPQFDGAEIRRTTTRRRQRLAATAAVGLISVTAGAVGVLTRGAGPQPGPAAVTPTPAPTASRSGHTAPTPTAPSPGTPSTPASTPAAPATLPPQALAAFHVACTRTVGQAAQVTDTVFAYDPDTHTYAQPAGDPQSLEFTPSPDGTSTLVVDPAAGRWAVAGWSDAVSRYVPAWHPLPDPELGAPLSWTADGAALVEGPSRQPRQSTVTLPGQGVAFLDPATGAVHRVPIPNSFDALTTPSAIAGWTADTAGHPQFILLSDDRRTVTIADASSSVLRTVRLASASPEGAAPLLSPDRGHLAFVTSGAFQVYDLDGSGALVQQYTATQDTATLMPFLGWSGADDVVMLPGDNHVEVRDVTGAVLRSAPIPLPSGMAKPDCTVSQATLGAAYAFRGALTP